MFVLVALENFQLGQQLVAEPVLRNHPLHRVHDQPFRLLLAHLGHRGVLLAALPAGIAHVFLGRFLFAGQADLLRIDDHHKIAGVQMRRVDGFVFTAQNIGNLYGQTAQHGAIGINHVPLALVQIHFRQIRFHL